MFRSGTLFLVRRTIELVEEGYSIYSTEVILLVVLTQEIRLEDDNYIIAKS